MKRLLLALLLLPALALAQTTPSPPVVTMPMPAPAVTVTAGSNITLSWNAVTESTTGALLTGTVTYNLWNVSTGTAVLLASGLATTSSVRAKLAIGTPCYVVTASVAGDIDSVGSTTVCANVIAAPVQVAAPTGLTVKP